MVLSAKISKVSMLLSEVDLGKNVVSIQNAGLRGGDILLDYFPEKAKPAEEDSVKVAWAIFADKITLDEVHYKMHMLPTIEEMDAKVSHAELKNGYVDTGKSLVDVDYFGVDSMDVRYEYPTPEYLASHPVAEPDSVVTASSDTALWTVKGRAVRLTNSHAVYAMAGAKPVSGLDMNYMEVGNVNIAIDSLYLSLIHI